MGFGNPQQGGGTTGISDGTLGAPSIGFTGNSSNTGFYLSAADQMSAVADGTRMFDINATYAIQTRGQPIDVGSSGGSAFVTQGSVSGSLQLTGQGVSAIRCDTNGPQLNQGFLTAGTLTYANASKAVLTHCWHKFSWTNAMVTALGAVTLGDITVCTLPAKIIVTNAYIVITGAETALAGTYTVALGRTAATYIDYIVASNGKAAANTVYGDVSGERGTNLTGYDVPSYTGTTDVKIHLISSIGNLSTALGSTGDIYLETAIFY